MALSTLLIWISGRICISISLCDEFAHVVQQHRGDADQPRDEDVLVGLAVARDAVASDQSQCDDRVRVQHLVPMQRLRIDLPATGLLVGGEELCFWREATD